MKKFLSLLLPFAIVASISVIVTACEKNPEDDDMDKMLIGQWSNSLNAGETFIMTFGKSGYAEEMWPEDPYPTKEVGTYTYANGKITSWMPEKGSDLYDVIGPFPWTIVSISSTSMVLKSNDDSFSSITFTRI